MRPGPHQFAMDDTWTAGPDIGNETKAELTQAHIDEGYTRQKRPGPDIFNYLQHKQSLTHDFAAKMFVSNWTVEATLATVAGHDVFASTHLQRAGDIDILLYMTASGGGGNLNEYALLSGRKAAVLASNPIVAVPAGVVQTIDADADDVGGYRCVVVDSAGGTDQVYYATGFGGGAWAASAIGGAPALNWQAVGCDRRSTGGANTKWLIGDDGGGGNAVIYASINNCANFANVAGYPALGAGEQIRFIGHTCHPADAVNTDDPGNPSWLVLTNNRACVSADGVTWSNAVHGFGFVPNKKSAAYSRTARRWVVTRGGSNNIYYSDDNGVTWTTLAGALPGTVPTAGAEIKCDDYGTFVIKDSTSGEAVVSGEALAWVSTDDGMTWSQVILPYITSAILAVDSWCLEVGKYSGNDWKSAGNFGTFFYVAWVENGTPILEPVRSLVY